MNNDTELHLLMDIYVDDIYCIYCIVLFTAFIDGYLCTLFWMHFFILFELN